MAVYLATAAIGLGALIASLLGSNSVVPQVSVGVVSHAVVYTAFGVFCGLMYPKHYWITVLGLCSAAFAMASIFTLLISSGESIQQTDLDTMSYGFVVTAASFAGACAGVAVGRRLRRRR